MNGKFNIGSRFCTKDDCLENEERHWCLSAVDDNQFKMITELKPCKTTPEIAELKLNHSILIPHLLHPKMENKKKNGLTNGYWTTSQRIIFLNLSLQRFVQEFFYVIKIIHFMIILHHVKKKKKWILHNND